jgi:L-malate glycosyltransferase
MRISVKLGSRIVCQVPIDLDSKNIGKIYWFFVSLVKGLELYMIVFVHLLNDRSGSPRVLAAVIAALTNCQNELQLFVGKQGSGILNDTKVRTTRYWYRRMPYKILTLVTFFASQINLMASLFRAKDIDKSAVIYVNTLLPFGGALFGWLTGRTVIYHLHEVSVTPNLFLKFLTCIVRLSAKKVIYVSNYHKENLPIFGVDACVIYNSVDQSISERALDHHYQHRYEGFFNVLMIASLRDYKGVPEFVALARRLSQRNDLKFILVVNDDDDAIWRYFRGTTLPPNLRVYPRTQDPAIFYTRSNLVLNLSRPDKMVETFGLTLLEAMTFGIPVIAPPVGGQVEFIDDGVEGYLVDSRNSESLDKLILLLAEKADLCARLSSAARARAKIFSPPSFVVNLREEVLGKDLVVSDRNE